MASCVRHTTVEVISEASLAGLGPLAALEAAPVRVATLAAAIRMLLPRAKTRPTLSPALAFCFTAFLEAAGFLAAGFLAAGFLATPGFVVALCGAWRFSTGAGA